MYSVFPEILFLSPLAPFLIRIALAVLFAHSSWTHVRMPSNISRVLALFEFAIAIAFALGAWTQVAAFAGIFVTLLWLIRAPLRTTARSSALLALVMCLTLLVTGAGAFAFDIPL